MTRRQSIGLALALLLSVVALAIAIGALLSWPPIGPIGTEAAGDTNFTNLVASGDLTVGDDATITDALSAADLVASDDLTVGDDLTVLDAIVGDDLTITNTVAAADLTASDDLTVGDDATFTDDVVVGGDTTVTGTVTGGDLYSGNRLTVVGETTMADAVTIGANLTVTGTVDFSGAGGLTFGDSVENLLMPTVDSASIVYTSTGALWTAAESEVWFIHAVYCHVTTNFDCTGDNCTLTIGDGNDANGFLDLADAELQAADTEGTGAPAGWQGFMSTDTIGAYLAEGLGFVYTNDTIDLAIGGTDPAAGAATCYLVYTRIQ